MLYFVLIFIGVANALPIPLTGSTLSIWLTELGFSLDVIGAYSLIGIPFTFKILWSPVIDQWALPGFSNSPRKGWLFFALIGIALSIFALSQLDIGQNPGLLAVLLFILSFFSSCLYMTGISYELESLRDDQYGQGSFYVLTGYRLGLVCAGSGALYLSFIWNWSLALQILALLTLIGAALVLLQPEPFKSKAMIAEKKARFSAYPTFLQGFWQETIHQPCRHFFQNPQWKLILFLLFAFKLGDHMAKSMEGPFYLAIGFNKAELAAVSKLWGMISTVFGAFIAGYFVKNRNPMTALITAGLIHTCTLPGYYWLASIGKSMTVLYCITTLGHLTGGMAITIFVYFLWKICDKSFAAVQYALLWSLFMVKSDIFAFLGGMLAAYTKWEDFFLIVTLLGLSTAILSSALIFRMYPKAVEATSIK